MKTKKDERENTFLTEVERYMLIKMILDLMNTMINEGINKIEIYDYFFKDSYRIWEKVINLSSSHKILFYCYILKDKTYFEFKHRHRSFK